jgi:glucose/mannose-6-phosphate isomerase
MTMRPSRSVLDDPQALAAGDPSGMLGMVSDLPDQLRLGYSVGRRATNLPSGEGIRSILVCGMGGSGVAGDVLQALAGDHIGVPLWVAKGYRLPEWCGPQTLVLAFSFSGNTEETLAAYDQAVSRGARVVTVSAGGELEERSRGGGTPHVRLPSVVSMPRAALGYLAGCAVGIVESVGLLPSDLGLSTIHGELTLLAEQLSPSTPTHENQAKSLAEWLVGSVPIVWGSEGVAAVAALRWKCQLNENAKVPAFHSEFPELDHNEIEGWSAGSGEAFRAVALRHPGEHPRVALRVDATLQAIADSGLSTREVRARGDTTAGWLFSLIMQGDMTSTYLAILAGVDPTEIPKLTGLKKRLGR